jgi:hypothetical protein
MATGGRKTHLQVLHECAIELGPTSPLTGVLGVLPAGGIIQQHMVAVFTPWDSTTANVALGSTPSGNDLVAGIDLKTGGHTTGFTAVPGCGPYATDKPIYYTITLTGPAPTTGRAVYGVSFLPGPG